jgi:hypothetical protein
MTTAAVPITATTATARRRWSRSRTQDVASSEPASITFTWGNRRPGTAGFARWTALIGQLISDHGLAASREVDNLFDVARRSGVATVAVQVLSDSSQPEVARCRAFAVVVSALTKSAR